MEELDSKIFEMAKRIKELREIENLSASEMAEKTRFDRRIRAL